MLWGFPLVTIIVAGFLKLVYIRHGSYYIEHIMHLINFHSVLLIMCSVFLVYELFAEGEFDANKYNLAFLLSGLHMTYSLKKYYNDSWWKSLIKGFLILFFYTMTVSMVILLIFGISVLLF